MTHIVLKTVVFLGSSKNVIPPWGGPSRLGDRVLKYVTSTLADRESKLGEDTVSHSVTVFDPIDVFGPGGPLEHSGAELKSPTFFQKEMSEKTAEMKETLLAADSYICVTPEYNHGVPPALQSMVSHFGGSVYKMKPSAIITYSGGPWGGTRCSMALQPILHELGCLPVSKMAAYPGASELMAEDGTWNDENHRMKKQLPDVLVQLEWMAVAMKRQRELSTF